MNHKNNSSWLSKSVGSFCKYTRRRWQSPRGRGQQTRWKQSRLRLTQLSEENVFDIYRQRLPGTELHTEQGSPWNGEDKSSVLSCTCYICCFVGIFEYLHLVLSADFKGKQRMNSRGSLRGGGVSVVCDLFLIKLETEVENTEDI